MKVTKRIYAELSEEEVAVAAAGVRQRAAAATAGVSVLKPTGMI